LINLLWWHWLALGLILCALEMASGGFYVLFFGIGALVVGGLSVAGVAGPAWLQLLLFSGVSIVSLMFFRKPLLRWLNLEGPGRSVDSLVGETAVALEDIATADVGRAELRGTVWTARNAGGEPLHRGQRCVVVRVEQLTIYIKPEGAHV
jgi:membrane protein implicated in regulation of membrane protease activity